jgi:hypothetical protein
VSCIFPTSREITMAHHTGVDTMATRAVGYPRGGFFKFFIFIFIFIFIFFMYKFGILTASMEKYNGY